MSDDLLKRLDDAHYPQIPLCKRAASRIRELEAQLAKAEKDCAMFADANARQATCISFTAANLGPECSGTIEGLPKAARHAAARIRELEAQLAATCQREAATTKRYDDRICEIEAQLAAPVAVKVKPLVWEAYKNHPFRMWRARCDVLGEEFVIWRSCDDVDYEKASAETEREARILAAIEAVPVAEVWCRAMEAAAQAADDMRASLWADTPSKCLTDIGALHEIAAAIRATPMPDDLR